MTKEVMRYTVEYYSTTIKKKEEEILPFATTWMVWICDLEGIILSEISQTWKDKYDIISLIYGI